METSFAVFIRKACGDIEPHFNILSFWKFMLFSVLLVDVYQV